MVVQNPLDSSLLSSLVSNLFSIKGNLSIRANKKVVLDVVPAEGEWSSCCESLDLVSRLHSHVERRGFSILVGAVIKFNGERIFSSGSEQVSLPVGGLKTNGVVHVSNTLVEVPVAVDRGGCRKVDFEVSMTDVLSRRRNALHMNCSWD